MTTSPNSSAAQNGVLDPKRVLDPADQGDTQATTDLTTPLRLLLDPNPQPSITVGPYRITQTQYGQYWVGEKDRGC